MARARWNPLNQADEHRAVAMDRRNRGLPTYCVAKPIKRTDPEGGHLVAATVRAAWQFACGEAQEAFRFAVYPERYEEIPLF